MKKLPTEYTVGTISEYQETVSKIFEQWETEIKDRVLSRLWFRGQCKDEPLLPKVLRKDTNPDTGEKCNYNELYINTAFSSLYRNYTIERFEERSSEIYSFMQHYGIPTRLLDWTENGFYALYFAVNGGAYDKDEQRVVWIMNPGAINCLTKGSLSYNPLMSHVPYVQARMKMPGYKDTKIFKEKEPAFAELEDEKLKYPISFYPTSSGNIRIAAQKGCFTIHGTENQPIESFFVNHDDIHKYLVKIKILKGSVTSVREQLKIMGITTRSVYPDIFGLAAELSVPGCMRS
jgi:hypothetical protein